MNRPEIEAMQARCDAASLPTNMECMDTGFCHPETPWTIGPMVGADEADEVALLCAGHATFDNARMLATAPTDLHELIAWALELEEEIESLHHEWDTPKRPMCLCQSCAAHRSRNR